MIGAIRITAVVAVAAAATVAANFVLVGVATGQHDPVGKLDPRAGVVTSAPPRAKAPLPPTSRRGEVEKDD
jgi:hypothetical protein